MPHDRMRLRAAIEQLQQQLAGLPQVDSAQRERLEQTLVEISRLAEDDAAGAERVVAAEGPPLAHRLSEAAQHFEESHPTLSGMIGSVIDTLGRMGI